MQNKRTHHREAKCGEIGKIEVDSEREGRVR